MSQRRGLKFDLLVVLVSSDPSKCHSMIVAGRPIDVPTAMYSTLSPCWQSNGVGLSKKSGASFSPRTFSTITVLGPQFLIRNISPFSHSESPHGSRSSGLLTDVILFASANCVTWSRNALTICADESTCAFSESTSCACASACLRASSRCPLIASSCLSKFLCAVSASFFAFRELINHVIGAATIPAMVMSRSIHAVGLLAKSPCKRFRNQVITINSSPNCSARTPDMRDTTNFRRGPGGSPNAARRIPLFIVPGGE